MYPTTYTELQVLTVDGLRELNQLYWDLSRPAKQPDQAARSVSLSLTILKGHLMTGANKRGRKAASGSNGSKTFWVNLALRDEDVERLEQNLMGNDELVRQLAILVAAGYEITCKSEGDGSRFAVFLFGPKGDHPNAGKALTARAGELSDALNAVLFKHYVLLGGTWPGAAPRSENRFS